MSEVKCLNIFKPSCVLGYYPCITNPTSKDCAVMDKCPRGLYFCKYVKFMLPDGTDISCRHYSFDNLHCKHGGGSCGRIWFLERKRFGGSREIERVHQ
jgi:hypothetical protein